MAKDIMATDIKEKVEFHVASAIFRTANILSVQINGFYICDKIKLVTPAEFVTEIEDAE